MGSIICGFALGVLATVIVISVAPLLLLWFGFIDLTGRPDTPPWLQRIKEWFHGKR
jgi:hypothetical protein